MRLFIVLSLFSFSALAQVIDIDINGRPYSCTPRSNGGGNQIECVEVAYAGPFTRDESMRLCAGARNDGPARCALKAYAGPFTRDESLNLCTGAYSVGPADCVIKAYAGPFTRDESLRLCSSPYSSVATADCALRAYSGPYTREESIRMCQGNKSLGKDVELLSKEESDHLLVEAVEKSVREGTYKR